MNEMRTFCLHTWPITAWNSCECQFVALRKLQKLLYKTWPVVGRGDFNAAVKRCSVFPFIWLFLFLFRAVTVEHFLFDLMSFECFLFQVCLGIPITSCYIPRLLWWPASRGEALFAIWRWDSKMLTWCHWSGSWWYRSIVQQTWARTTPHLRPHTLRLKVGNKNSACRHKNIHLHSGSQTDTQLAHILVMQDWKTNTLTLLVFSIRDSTRCDLFKQTEALTVKQLEGLVSISFLTNSPQTFPLRFLNHLQWSCVALTHLLLFFFFLLFVS